ncbi:MAG TPA: hypothetical protein VN228_10225 [Pyrinomonadaceae bacterium]|nr:hypothetical protein [Pyrinomonadaceae bacterium]
MVVATRFRVLPLRTSPRTFLTRPPGSFFEENFLAALIGVVSVPVLTVAFDLVRRTNCTAPPGFEAAGGGTVFAAAGVGI